MDYGLIGARLGHSFSKPIHESLCGYSYELCPLPTEAEFEAFMQARAFKAINVTIPYKQAVIPYCAEIDAQAAAIGAVNTIVNRGGALYGYNTDYAGFQFLATQNGISFSGAHVLILGTGGTQKTVRAVVTNAGAASVAAVSRTPDAAAGEISYADALAHTETTLLVNTTPAGMYPNNGTSPLPQLADGAFPQLAAVLDVVYNPLRTALVLDAQARGIPAAGGLAMLVAQAKYAAEIFTGTQLPEREIVRIFGEMTAERTNLSFIGMPGCGKSSIGQRVAARLGKRFIDLDTEIAARAGKSIPAIFAQDGEAGFRALESAVCADYGKETGCVLSTGGGVVLRAENVRALRQNGVVLCLDRPLDALQTGCGRPLSQNAVDAAALYKVRAPLYRAAADRILQNTGTPDETAAAAQEAFYEITHFERP